MDYLTNEQILEKYEKLPEDLKEVIFSVEMSETIKKIGEKYGLYVDKIGELGNETGMVMLGLISVKDYIPNLASRLGINKEIAGKIAGEVNAQIFFKVRESLKKLHGIDGIETSEIKKEDIKREIEKEEPKIPDIMRGVFKPNGVEVKPEVKAETPKEPAPNPFEVKMKEGVSSMPKEEKHYSQKDPYREPIE